MSDDVLVSLRSKFANLVELRDEKDIAKKKADKLKDEYDALQEELWEAMEDSGLGSLKLEIGDENITFVARETLYGSVFDKDAAAEAFKKDGRFDEYTGIKFEAKRINELVRECIENGQELPEGVDFYSRRLISISRKQA